MKAVESVRSTVGVAAICRALVFPRPTFYRRKRRDGITRAGAVRSTRAQHRALSVPERQTVLNVLHEPRFVDKAPPEVYAMLLDDGVHYCSTRTMYRILNAEHEVKERRDLARRPAYAKPELVATGPNQVWSWDITKLKGPAKWSYFYLYVILDIFSRYVVGWMLAEHENARLAKRLIAETILRERVSEDRLVLHSDRGAPMTALTTAQLLAHLGVTPSFSRPQTSNDNPFSESQFKTLKYSPGFPDRCDSYMHALTVCRTFFPWYNEEHRHSGIGYLTPAMVHRGTSATVVADRAATLARAYAAHPERFVHGRPRPKDPPTTVWINRPPDPSGDQNAH